MRALSGLAFLLLTATLHAVPHEATITRWADFYGVPRWLALKVAETESIYDSAAVTFDANGGQSRGLFQINKRYQGELADRAGVRGFRWWNADDSAHVGLAYLARLHRRYGDWMLAVAAYNCGPGRLESARALPSETIEYLRRIFG